MNVGDGAYYAQIDLPSSTDAVERRAITGRSGIFYPAPRITVRFRVTVQVRVRSVKHQGLSNRRGGTVSLIAHPVCEREAGIRHPEERKKYVQNQGHRGGEATYRPLYANLTNSGFDRLLPQQCLLLPKRNS